MELLNIPGCEAARSSVLVRPPSKVSTNTYAGTSDPKCPKINQARLRGAKAPRASQWLRKVLDNHHANTSSNSAP